MLYCRSVFYLPKPLPLNHLVKDLYRGRALVLQGAKDPLNDARGRAQALQDSCPNVSVHLLDAGHCPVRHFLVANLGACIEVHCASCNFVMVPKYPAKVGMAAKGFVFELFRAGWAFFLQAIYHCSRRHRLPDVISGLQVTQHCLCCSTMRRPQSSTRLCWPLWRMSEIRRQRQCPK